MRFLLNCSQRCDTIGAGFRAAGHTDLAIDKERFMKLLSLTPFIRFADVLRFTTKRGPSKTYDGRMLYGLSGEAEFTAEGETYEITGGTFVLFPSGTRYVIQPKKEIVLAVFDLDLTGDYKERTAILPPCPAERFNDNEAHERVTVDDAPELSGTLVLNHAVFLEPLIRRILKEFKEKRVRYREVSSALFQELLAELVRDLEAMRDQKNVVSRVMAYVDQHPDLMLTNEAVGEALFYNPNYLNRVLAEKTGMTLHRFVLERKLNQAKMLLFSTDLTIREIASSLGFGSLAHFSNFIKKETGCSPMELRKSGAL